jgi:menaquinone-9 beta-reductase
MSGAFDHDVAIVGGGPAGASAACLLARAGRAALLIERDTGPRHKICGEFLSVEAQSYLAELGVDPRALGGVPIRLVRLVHERETAEARLPFEGLGLTRRTLDDALLRRAEASGARILRGDAAREIAQDASALKVSLRGERSIRARTVFLATGKHDLRNPKRPAGTSGDDLIGFKTYLDLAPAQRRGLQDAVEIVLFDGGYAGLQSVETGTTNLCLLVQRALFARLGRSWDALVEHLCQVSTHLRMRLDGAAALLEKPLSIANVPYGFMHRGAASEPDGLFRLGDQMGVIPSFSGDGIAIALHTARLAAGTYLERGNAAAAFHGRVREDIGRPIRLASAVYGFSQARLARLAALWAFRLYPAALGALATRTRIPAPALQRGRAGFAGG